MPTPFTRSEIETGRRLFTRRVAVFRRRQHGRRAAADARDRDRLRRPLQCRQVEPDQRAHRPQGARAHLAHARPHPGTDLLPGRGRPQRRGHARLRLCRRRQIQDRGLDRADPRLSARPAQSRARLCADRCAPRAEGDRQSDPRCARQCGRQPPDRAHQMRRGEEIRTGQPHRRGGSRARQAPGRLPERAGDVVGGRHAASPNCARRSRG